MDYCSIDKFKQIWKKNIPGLRKTWQYLKTFNKEREDDAYTIGENLVSHLSTRQPTGLPKEIGKDLPCKFGLSIHLFFPNLGNWTKSYVFDSVFNNLSRFPYLIAD